MVMRTTPLDVAIFSSPSRVAYQQLGDDRYIVVEEDNSGGTFRGNLISWYNPQTRTFTLENLEPWGIVKTDRFLREHDVPAKWLPWETEPTHPRSPVLFTIKESPVEHVAYAYIRLRGRVQEWKPGGIYQGSAVPAPLLTEQLLLAFPGALLLAPDVFDKWEEEDLSG